MSDLRAKSEKLTGYLESSDRQRSTTTGFRVITPRDPHSAAASFRSGSKMPTKVCSRPYTRTRDFADWREPDVIRVAPVPLYNSFSDVFQFAKIKGMSEMIARERSRKGFQQSCFISLVSRARISYGRTKVIIIGAGLAGSLLSIYLAKRGIAVDVYEARGDMRLEEVAAGRSINLALSDRGIAALREVGMDEYMLAEAVPMYGRMIHSLSGETKLLPYSGRQGEYINSVSRAGLNIALINEAEKYDGVTFYFNERCVDFDCGTGSRQIFKRPNGERRTPLSQPTVPARPSATAMLHGGVERLIFRKPGSSTDTRNCTFRRSQVEPARQSLSGSHFAIEPNALHIWPRHKFMMIALPNFDGSFTCTLFLAHKGENSFEEVSYRSTATARIRISAPDLPDQLDRGKICCSNFSTANFPTPCR